MSSIDFFTGQRKSTVPKKNFIKENINRLKRDKSKQQPLATKFGSLSSIGVENIYKKEEKLAPGFKLKFANDILAQPNGPVPTGFRSQASQTVNEKDLDTIYHEGVIRYPSSRCASSYEGGIKIVREMGLQTERILFDRTPSPEPVEKPQYILTKNAAGDLVKDHVKCNAMVQISPKKKMDDAGDPTLPPPNYQKGVLPKYLRDIKKKQDKVKEEEEAKDPDCPPDHSLLPEEKRLLTLENLKQHYNSLLKELNCLPVRSDTLRTKKRRMELEKELEKLDAGMKLFSQDKLFVKKQS